MGNQLGRSRITISATPYFILATPYFISYFLIFALRNIPTRRVLILRSCIDPRPEPTTTTGVIKMNWDRVEGNWKEFKGSVQEKWGKLTDDDLNVIEGKRTQLAGRLQQRYGVAKDQAEKEIDAWLKTVN